MKTKSISYLVFIILLQIAQPGLTQNEVSLEECYQAARTNYPNLRTSEFMDEISALKKENIESSRLPQISVNGQATYQSDVTKLNLSQPNLSVPTVSKDQYKVYVDFRQSIWDGGAAEANSQLEDAILHSNLSELEVELYKLKEKVAQTFFNILSIDQQVQVLNAQKEVLLERLNMVNSGIRNQIMEQSAAWAIQAELVNLEQNIIQLQSGKATSIKILSVLTGRNLSEDTRFIYTDIPDKGSNNNQRPEYQMFFQQQNKLDTQAKLIERQQKPKVFGFGQAGYGKPGLNMLNNEFDTYYLAGIGVTWNPFDWNQTRRQKQILQLQRQNINQQEETFKNNLEILLVQQQEQIKKLEKMLKMDEQLVQLKADISRSAFSKFENGTMNSAEYVRELQAELIARINKELHKIQLMEARELHEIIKGKGD